MGKAKTTDSTFSSCQFVCFKQKQLNIWNKGWLFLLSVFFILTLPQKAHTMTDEELAAKFMEMEKKIEKQQVLIEEQNKTIQTLKNEFNNRRVKSSNITNPDNTMNREEVKKMVAQLMDEKLPVPGWLNGLKFGGDFRLRYEGIFNRDDRDDRHRGRFRLRLKIAKKLCDEIDLIIRLASASGSGITSTNQSFDDAFSEKDLWIDRAYMVYKPNFLPGLELGGGKMKNPLIHTDIMWDSDVNPEGAYEHYSYSLTDRLKPFLTLAQLFIYENNSTRDASLFVYQAGFDWKINGNLWTLAAAYYDYTNLEDSQMVNDHGSHGNTIKPRKSAKGGQGFASDFNLVNITSFWKTKVCGGVPLKLYSDYIKNISSSNDSGDYAYALGFSLGKIKKKGDWKFSYKYGRIEPDAVVGLFADANFGGSNRRGNKISLNYQFHECMIFGATVWNTDSVRGHQDEITDIALDLKYKF